MKPEKPIQNRWCPTLPDEIYHADKSAVNATSLKAMSKSPRAFHEAFYGPPKPPTASMRMGRKVHMALLEPERFKTTYVVQPIFEGKTKDGKITTSAASNEVKAMKDQWLASLPPEHEVMTRSELEELEKMVNAIERNSEASKLLRIGQAEIAGYYADPETGISCRIKPDIYDSELNCLIDLKTTDDCTVDAFAKTIWNYKYYLSMAMYKYGIEQIEGQKVEHVVYVAVERKPFYEVAVYEADQTMIERGLADYCGYMKQLNESLKTGVWKNYQDTLGKISLPKWIPDSFQYKH